MKWNAEIAAGVTTITNLTGLGLVCLALGMVAPWLGVMASGLVLYNLKFKV